MSNLKQNWEVVEHSWSDTSIVCGDKTICTISIYDEATEDTQDELEDEVSSNFKLIAAAPQLLEALKNTLSALENFTSEWPEVIEAKRVIEKATMQQ